MRSPGTRTKVYVDTNIYLYAILHHPQYGQVCAEVLRDLGRGLFSAYGSTLVAIELLGALSKINPHIARRALEDYMALPITILELDETVLMVAALINEVVNVRYDAVHAALMALNGISNVITNDLDDWAKLARRFQDVIGHLQEEGYDVLISAIEVVSPDTYVSWRRGLQP